MLPATANTTDLLISHGRSPNSVSFSVGSDQQKFIAKRRPQVQIFSLPAKISHPAILFTYESLDENDLHLVFISKESKRWKAKNNKNLFILIHEWELNCKIKLGL